MANKSKAKAGGKAPLQPQQISAKGEAASVVMGYLPNDVTLRRL